MKTPLCLAVLFASMVLGSACSSNNLQNSQMTLSNPHHMTGVEAQQKASRLLVTDPVVQRLMQHVQALENIGVQHGGHRAVGSTGGMATAEYIIAQAKKNGFEAQILPFEHRTDIVGQNILVEIQGKDMNHAAILGAHYDSVKQGPGINDNASGVAVLLELLQQYAQHRIQPQYTLYFAFWDAEEDGLGGSRDFVAKMTDQQLRGIKAYINLDMVGTQYPDIVITDADHSSLVELEAQFKENGVSPADYLPVLNGLKTRPTHTGDAALENHLKDFFQQKQLEVKEDLSTLAASDTAPFLGKVPVTSIMFLHEQQRQGEQEGEVILDFVPCYHQACDTLKLVNPQSMKLALEAIQYLMQQLQAE